MQSTQTNTQVASSRAIPWLLRQTRNQVIALELAMEIIRHVDRVGEPKRNRNLVRAAMLHFNFTQPALQALWRDMPTLTPYLGRRLPSGELEATVLPSDVVQAIEDGQCAVCAVRPVCFVPRRSGYATHSPCLRSQIVEKNGLTPELLTTFAFYAGCMKTFNFQGHPLSDNPTLLLCACEACSTRGPDALKIFPGLTNVSIDLTGPLRIDYHFPRNRIQVPSLQFTTLFDAGLITTLALKLPDTDTHFNMGSLWLLFRFKNVQVLSLSSASPDFPFFEALPGNWAYPATPVKVIDWILSLTTLKALAIDIRLEIPPISIHRQSALENVKRSGALASLYLCAPVSCFDCFFPYFEGLVEEEVTFKASDVAEEGLLHLQEELLPKMKEMFPHTAHVSVDASYF